MLSKFSFEKDINTPKENTWYDKPTWSLICEFMIPEFKDVSSCYEVHDILLKAGVARKNTDYDHESCCCYYYFHSEKSARNFIDRLNKYLEACDGKEVSN